MALHPTPAKHLLMAVLLDLTLKNGLRLPGSLQFFLLLSDVFGTILASHLRQICLGRPYHEHMTPDNTAPMFIGARKPLHLDKVMDPWEIRDNKWP